MHEEIEPVEALFDLRKDVRHLRVVGDVARQDQRLAERRRQLAHVLFEPLSLICDREPGTGVVSRVRDGPGN